MKAKAKLAGCLILLLACADFALAHAAGGAAARVAPQGANVRTLRIAGGYDFYIAGFDDAVKPCSEQIVDTQEKCSALHAELLDLVEAIVVSRREHARNFISNYLARKFDKLTECLRTTCGGLFVVEPGGPEWAERWSRMLEFQACIHAAPAVSKESLTFGVGYSAMGLYQAALDGKVPDCPATGLAPSDRSLLARFNLAGVF